MRIDWSTFVLEMVNFLVLVWILQRFLYRPVRATLAARQAGIERTAAEARATAEAARALQGQFEARLADWEKEKAAARAALDVELAAERERRLQGLERALADERARSAARDEHRREALRDELEGRALAQAQRFAATLLGRLSGPALDDRLADVFVEDLERLPEAEAARLRTAAAEASAAARVVSAHPLGAPQRQRLSEALAGRLGRPLALEFGEDAGLGAGLRVSLGAWRLGASLADELAFFATTADHAE